MKAADRGDPRVHGGAVFVMRRAYDGSPDHRAAASHTYAVLAYHVGGATRVEQRGQWTLGPGDVLLIPAGEPHRLVMAEGADLWGVGFCVACLLAEAGGSALLGPFERVRGGASGVVHIPADRRGYIEVLLRELQGASERTDEAGLRVQRSLLTLLLDEVARAFVPDQVVTGEGVVADSLRFIERRCLAPLTLKEVAAAVRRSPAYVTTALRQATGRSAVQWIVAGRMAEARRRLLHSDERVEVIAERVGYADATQFIRMFRREHGVTPAAWRAQQQRRGPA